ncbi:MAG: hypothetical protein M1836_004777 [Candelina mexicana]|nr:MAG: hypothetical protein M1836_004777 [Candelina mexicana]
MSFLYSDDSTVVEVPMALSPPSSRRASEVLPPLAISQTTRPQLNNQDATGFGAATTDYSRYRMLSQYCDANIGAATTDYSNSTTLPKECMFPPLADGSSIYAINRSNGTGWGSFGTVVTDKTLSMYSRSSEQSQSQTQSTTPAQTSARMPLQTTTSNPSSDPFDLELNKLFPRESPFNNLIKNDSSKLKRLTTQPARVTHSAAPSFAGTSSSPPDRPFITPCAKTTPTRKVGGSIDVDYHAGLQILFSAGKLPEAQVHTFSIMVNKLSAISRVLFNPLAEDAIADWEMDETKRVTESIIITYEEIHEDIKRKEEALKKVMVYLPNLTGLDDMDELHMGIKIWKQRLAVSNICNIDSNTINVFDYFSKYYDTTVYHLFLSTIQRKPGHNIRELSPHLNSVYACVEAVNIRARDLKCDINKMRGTLDKAKQKLKDFGEEVAVTQFEMRAWQTKLELVEEFGEHRVHWDELSWKEKQLLMRTRLRKREVTF